jgi:DUF3096 family protein
MAYSPAVVRFASSGDALGTAFADPRSNREERMEALAILGKINLSLKLSIPGVLALIAGILILLFPRLLNYLVAIYLIVVGLVLVFNLHF